MKGGAVPQYLAAHLCLEHCFCLCSCRCCCSYIRCRLLDAQHLELNHKGLHCVRRQGPLAEVLRCRVWGEVGEGRRRKLPIRSSCEVSGGDVSVPRDPRSMACRCRAHERSSILSRPDHWSN